MGQKDVVKLLGGQLLMGSLEKTLLEGVTAPFYCSLLYH